MTTKNFFNHRVLWLLIPLLTLFNLSVWGAEKTETISWNTYTTSGTGATLTITWTANTSCTITQAKGDNTSNNVSTSYATSPRWYQYHHITFTPKTGYTIKKVVLTGSSNSYHGQNMTFVEGSGTISKSGNATTITGAWTSSFKIKMGSQFRPGSVVVTYETAAAQTYNVTLSRNGVTETINDVEEGTALDDIDGTGDQGGCSPDWVFEGWSKTQRPAQNNTAVMDLVTTVDGAGPYYAVYSHTEAGGGESTTVTMSSFSTVSGNVDNDANVSYEAAKGTAGTAPGVYSNVLRIYQNGGTLTITGNNGKKLTSITIGSSMATSVSYKIDGGTESANQSIAANGKFTLSDIEASSVLFTCKGTTSGSRLYLYYLSVTYSGGNTIYYTTSPNCGSTEPTYTLTLDSDLSCVTDGSATVELNATELTNFTPATRDGFTCSGYWSAPSGGVQVLNADGTFAATDVQEYITDGKWTNEGNVTLTPRWVCSNTMTLSVDTQSGGTYSLSKTSLETCDCTDNKRQVTITATPNSGYSVTDISYSGNGTATKVSGPTVNGENTEWVYQFNQGDNGNGIFTVTFTTIPTYTITWMANGQEFHKQQDATHGTDLAVPSAPDPETYACDDKVFVGWTATQISGTTNDEPDDLFTTKTAKVEEAATTYYAVFATVDAGGSTTDTYDWESDQTGNWTVDAAITRTQSQGVDESYAGKINTNNTYVTYNNKVAVTNFSFDFKRTSGNENYEVYIETSTDKSTWNAVATYPMTDFGNGSYTSKSHTFDGTQDLYVRFHCYNTTATRYVDNVSITYGGTSYSDYVTTCAVIPDPVWGGAVINRNSIKVDCGSMTKLNAADPNGPATISFPVATNHTLTYDITVTASEGFLVSTNKTDAAKYGASVTVSPNKTGDNAGKITQNVYVVAVAPAMSDEDFMGTITLSGKQLAENQEIDVTADVTCTTYTLTLDDRGTENTAEYYAGASVPKPADPEGVCTDPINYVFDGWSLDPVTDENTTSYEKVTFPFDMPAEEKTLYAVYRYVEDGGADSGDYVKVTANLDDYSGDYLFVYETGNVAFDGGRNDDELDGTNNTIEVTINDHTIESNATTDAAKFTIAKEDGGYSIKSASGYYIGRSAASNGLSTNETYSANYDLNTITDYKTITGKGGCILKYNNADNQKRFRYYNSAQEEIALYRKAASYLYTTSPICGPHLAITEGKEIYVTGGNAGGTRDLVIAQTKVSYKATRLEKDKSTGNLPSIKALPSNIVFDNTKTKAVAVTFDEDSVRTLQSDGTYTITGNITIAYQPAAANVTDDIQVTLNANYNPSADVSQASFTVHARSLPAEFVIVAKSGDKWYALNGDMNTNAANPANGQVTLDDDANPTKATYAPCNTIYTFDGLPNTGDRTYVRFQGTDDAWLWASSGTNVGIQNNVLKTTPEGNNNAYNWKLYTEDNITYRFGNANSSRQLTLSGEKFGMYASGVQDIRILPYDEKCLYNYAPTNLKVSVLKGSYITLTWDAVAGATKYQYSTDATNWNDAGTEPTVTINGLTGDKEYTYYIRAYHEDAGVSQECIDYAEITFTTANCDDVPTDITYTADLTSITVSWTAAASTATITYNIKEDGTGGGGTINNATSPYTISGGLNPNTTYYIQILADGTCGSPIIPVKTEDVKMDIVEWQPDGIVVDINTNEKVKVTLENEVSYGSGLGSLAEDLFFSKYFEGSGSLKMIAIYNGTGKDVDLSEYRIDRGSNGDATNINKTYDLSQLGIIKQGQEIIFYSWPLSTEYSYSCSQSFLNNVATKSGQEDNPRWILCGNDPTGKATPIYGDAMNFSGNDPLLLYKSSELIDVFGVSTAQESPASTQICSGRSDQAWSANGVTNMDYGKTEEDFEDGEIPHGVNVDDETITAYTARVIMFRKNTVVSGDDAVTKNIDNFVTFADEWEARQVCMSGDDGDLTCAAYQELGKFNYSEYYTKYESMDQDQEFDTNNRNADGTLTVPITELFKQSCRNIKITLKDAADNVLKEQPYKVPIMITSTQGTDGQTFIDLQQNLATVEVDVNGNPTGNKTNLTLEQVREICKTCDVVVRDNATLTKVTDGTPNDHPQVRNVYVYEGASIVIPDGVNHNYTINGLSLRRKGDEVASAQVQGTGKFVLPADEPVCLDLRVDANNWHWFTLPFDCDIADVTWIDGTPAKYNTDWFLMYYDGESRAASTNPYDNHWKVYSGTTIEAGKGYIVGITGDLTSPNYTFELRFPMAQDVLTAEQTNKTVPVNAWGVKSDNTPNNLGWNLVGNPYLNYYKTADVYSPLAGLPLIHYIDTDPVTGEWNYEYSGGVPYVATPIDGGWYEYQQELASGVNLMPFTAYFVQVGDPDNPDHTDGEEFNASFEARNRGKKSIVRRAPREVEEIEEPIIVRVELTNSKGESDKTSLVIDDRFTNEYEMNGDFFKWFGDYYNYYTKPVLYTIGADQGKRAFNALNEELAAQPIPMGMYAAQAGNYTFSLNQQFDLSRVEEVWLYDATQSTYTNLMQSDYTFSTSKVNGAGRFSLSVKLAPKVATSIDNVTADKVWATTHTKQVIVNGLDSSMHLWLYDATGKLLYNEPTSNYQHTYSVPQTGTYFVSVMKGNAKQTIKVVVE